MKVLEDLNNGQYERTMVESNHINAGQQKANSSKLKPGTGKTIIKDHIIR